MLSSCVSQKKYSALEGSYNRSKQELVDVKASLMKCQIENENKISVYKQMEKQIKDLKKDKEKTLEYVDKSNSFVQVCIR